MLPFVSAELAQACVRQRWIFRVSSEPISRERRLPQKFVQASGAFSRGFISIPRLWTTHGLILPVSTSHRLHRTSAMVVAARADLYTPFLHGFAEDGVQSSEEGSSSDIHSPIFEAPYPPEGKSHRSLITPAALTHLATRV